jgi:hypothetical protein
MTRTAFKSILAGLLALPALQATLITFETTLTGSQEVPPVATPATGFGRVTLDTVTSTFIVVESWSNLTSPAIASHIHGPAAPGVNAAILFPFDLGAGAGTTTGSIPEQSFAITSAQIGELQAGLYYMNVHSTNFPGGEIRGQLGAIPEPGTFILLGTGLTLFALARRSRRKGIN